MRTKTDFIKDGFKQIKAYCDMPTTCCEVPVCEVSRCDLDCLWSELSYLAKYIYRLEEELYKHENDGHLPKIPGADKMQKAIDILGLGGDYEVEKSRIWASDGSVKSEVFTISNK